MYNNVGQKIKCVAVVIAWIGIILGVISGIWVMTVYDSVVSGLLYILLAALFSWLGSLTLYGFGELICNAAWSYQLLYQMQYNSHNVVTAPSRELHNYEKVPTWQKVEAQKAEQNARTTCPTCGASNSVDAKFCVSCGKAINT